jgi:hypothetical protein
MDVNWVQQPAWWKEATISPAVHIRHWKMTTPSVFWRTCNNWLTYSKLQFNFNWDRDIASYSGMNILTYLIICRIRMLQWQAAFEKGPDVSLLEIQSQQTPT